MDGVHGHKSERLALMGLFNSNKGGNTSRSPMAEDERGDLHTPTLFYD